ncbi:branched-chain amino acid aminotransferase [Hahella sp. CCB-MM4]|uniref:aminotransferase class IV n=1 Tax=Hahella sp. (strain CCB-MM4) TaxID=1926491 RepID=UPI000B9B23E4|nr:aminotransferase class IV [Hahella sp. CCB-MM4]OZG75358.1 branched-chain amino acid aminotransferase [Hahella sp. CCB-MM4]
MTATSLCWMNREIKPTTECSIPVLDHGLLYGDGIFEGLRYYHGRVLHLDQHLARLQHSATAIQLTLPYTLEEIETAIETLISQYGEPSGYLRLVVTRGAGNLGLNPRHCPKANLFIIVDQLSLASQKAREEGMKLVTSTIRRMTGSGLDARVKSLNYLHSVLARIEANAANADEAILLNERGCIAEGTAENLFIELNGALLTPPCSDGALGGITRATVMKLARQLDIEVQERSLTTYDVYSSDACFMTGSGAGLLPVAELDGRKLKSSQGTLFLRIKDAFEAYIKAQCEK